MNKSDDQTAQMWRYTILPNYPSWNHWGIFVIDSTGFFSVVSDFGNYAFKWSSFGPCFKKFLCNIDTSYLRGKLKQDRRNQYDEEGTRKSIREGILELRQDGSITKEEAQEEWDLSDDLECFEVWSWDTNMSDTHEYYQIAPDSDLLGFSKNIWPHFIKALQEDIK